jgi:hypothetical protein
MSKISVLVLLLLMSIHHSGAAEESFLKKMVDDHASTFEGNKKIVLKFYQNTNKVGVLEKTQFKISSPLTTKCGSSTLSARNKKGNPEIYLCATGFRFFTENIELFAYAVIYYGTNQSADSSQGIEYLLNKHMNYVHKKYLTFQKSPAGTEVKLCHPLLYLYLFIHYFDANRCEEYAADRYPHAVAWLWSSDPDGLINLEKIHRTMRSFGVAESELPTEFTQSERQDYISTTIKKIYAGAWRHQLYHEFAHIANGDIGFTDKTQPQQKDRELLADKTAVEILLSDAKEADPRYMLGIAASQTYLTVARNFMASHRMDNSVQDLADAFLSRRDEMPTGIVQQLEKLLCADGKCTSNGR